jgi:hypothetical protein
MRWGRVPLSVWPGGAVRVQRLHTVEEATPDSEYRQQPICWDNLCLPTSVYRNAYNNSMWKLTPQFSYVTCIRRLALYELVTEFTRSIS